MNPVGCDSRETNSNVIQEENDANALQNIIKTGCVHTAQPHIEIENISLKLANNINTLKPKIACIQNEISISIGSMALFNTKISLKHKSTMHSVPCV